MPRTLLFLQTCWQEYILEWEAIDSSIRWLNLLWHGTKEEKSEIFFICDQEVGNLIGVTAFPFLAPHIFWTSTLASLRSSGYIYLFQSFKYTKQLIFYCYISVINSCYCPNFKNDNQTLNYTLQNLLSILSNHILFGYK